MALPDTSVVIDALNAAETAESTTSAEVNESESTLGGEASKTEDVQQTTPPETPQPSDPVTSYSALIKEKGARAAFDLLPSDVKEQIAAEMYPGVHREMSKKEVARVAAKQELEQVRDTISKVVNDRFDELMTQGLTEEDKQAYLDKKRLAELDERNKQPAAPDPVQTQMLAEQQQKMEYAWSLVEKAGLPRDPNDPRVRALDFAWDETDFGKAMQRLSASVGKASPNGAKAPAGVATPAAAAPDMETMKKMAAEMAAEQVKAELRRLNLLAPDNGRPGTAAGTSPARSMTEAAARAREIIEHEMPGR